MNTTTAILVLGLLYFMAQGLSLQFSRTKIPDVLILMLIGIFAGPVFKIVTPHHFGAIGGVLTTIAMTVILFQSGTTLSLKALADSAKSTLVLSLITAFATMIIVTAGAKIFLGLELTLAIVTGAILAGTSSAVVIPMVKSLKLSEKPATILILESALTDVLCIVITVGLLQAMAQGSIRVGGVLERVLLSLAFATVIGLVGGIVWLKLLHKVRNVEATLFTSIAYAFFLYGISEKLGYSGAISVLAFGITLANAPGIATQSKLAQLTEMEKLFFNELVFILKTFFFLYLGISMQLDQVVIALFALLVVAVVYFARLWITRFTLAKDTSQRDASFVAILVPKGLAAAVLAGLPAQYGIFGAEKIQAFVYASVLFSIVITAVLVPLSERPFLQSKLKRFFSSFSESAT